MYSQSITRSHRTAFLFLIDRSGSMSELLPSDTKRTKAQAVGEICNTLLFELIERARREDGVRDYYDIGVIGYSGRGIESLLDDQWLIPISEFARRTPLIRSRWERCMLPDGGEWMRKISYPEWILPNAEGQTPLYEALCEIRVHLEKWCNDPRNRESFPPIVFHITDGEASDADSESLKEAARRLRELKTTDGNLLFINCHLSSSEIGSSLLFPTSVDELGENRYGQILYACSSEMPALFEGAIRELTGSTKPGPFRGMSFNCSPGEIMALLNIGSISEPIY